MSERLAPTCAFQLLPGRHALAAHGDGPTELAKAASDQPPLPTRGAPRRIVAG